MLDSRKHVFEELLWQHQSLTDAFAALQLSHNNCQGSPEPTGFFCTGVRLSHILITGSFCAAALPEASVDDLTA
jgi:hypothetical protein